MKLKLYQVDAFTSELFKGNSAAVCSLEKWLPDQLMQNIAMENNLAETAFFVKENGYFHIRWFTPTVEVDLCGHATLASAFVLFDCEGWAGPVVNFFSARSGKLSVKKTGRKMSLDLPSDVFLEIPISNSMLRCFKEPPIKAFKGKTDLMLVFEDEQTIRELKPDLAAIKSLGGRGLIVTSKGDKTDFVSRFFAPQSGIAEDPVTGSAHTTLVPYWSGQLKKTRLSAAQVSVRGGELQCEISGDRIIVSGEARLYMKGEITL
jgi:PhzF family phenazine biosynthesis protein